MPGERRERHVWADAKDILQNRCPRLLCANEIFVYFLIFQYAFFSALCLPLAAVTANPCIPRPTQPGSCIPRGQSANARTQDAFLFSEGHFVFLQFRTQMLHLASPRSRSALAPWPVTRRRSRWTAEVQEYRAKSDKCNAGVRSNIRHEWI